MSHKASLRDFWSQHSVRDVVANSQSVLSSQGTDNSPMPVDMLPDLVAKAPVGGEDGAAHAGKNKGAPRRSVAEMQLEMFNKGGHFLEFTDPETDPNGNTISRTHTYEKGARDFRCMEEKGFLVTKDGCLFPHEQYCTTGGGATLKGHQRSCYFFTGLAPEATTGDKPRKKYVYFCRIADWVVRMVSMGLTSSRACRKVVRDKDHWPTDSNISHRCHRRKCCRPDHLVYEPRVCNERRNYCGILSKVRGDRPAQGCDCLMLPACVQMYHPEGFEDPDLQLCKTRQEVMEALSDLSAKFPFKQLDRKAVRADALKAENDRQRKARGSAHLAKGIRNLKRVGQEPASSGAKKAKSGIFYGA